MRARSSLACLLGGLLLLLAPGVAAAHSPFQIGDVFASVSDGTVNRLAPADGSRLDTLDTTTTSTEMTGMCFDASGQLRTTNYQTHSISLFDNSGNLLNAAWKSFPNAPVSCVVDRSGHVWVGGIGIGSAGAQSILELDADGNQLQEFTVGTGGGSGPAWIDLASDGCTLYYATYVRTVLRFNACTNTQLPDLATGLGSPGNQCTGLRILADGSVLVACASVVDRVDSSGAVIKTYTPAEPFTVLSPLDLDPDGTSFWTADQNNRTVFRFDIASGTELNHFLSGASSGTTEGLAIFGDRSFGSPPPAPATVAGGVYQDLNSSGTRDPGEPGMAGVRVLVDKNGNGAVDPGEPSTVTIADGSYQLQNLQPGSMTVGEIAPGGFHCSAPATCSYTLTLNAGDNAAGKDFGNAPNSTTQPQPPPPPVEGVAVNAFLDSGTVLVKLPPGFAAKADAWTRAAAAGFVPISKLGKQVPVGSTIDTTHGMVHLFSAKDKAGGTQDGHFSQGLFVVQQARTSPLTTAVMTGSNLNACSKLPRGGAPKQVAGARSKRHRSLFASVHGRFTSRGRNSAATARGTEFLVKDTCSGTTTKVKSGVVTVRDFTLRKTVKVKAGHKYLARAPKRRGR